MFYGIIIRMYNEKGGKHNQPHIHAEYQGQKVIVNLDCEVLEGEFNPRKLRLLLAWIEIHHDELEANWNLLSQGEGFFKIDPLK